MAPGWMAPPAAFSQGPGRRPAGSEDLVGVLLILLLLLGCLAAQAIDVFHLEYLVHAVRVVGRGRQAAVAVDPYRTDSGRHRQRVERCSLERRAHVLHPDRQRGLGTELAMAQRAVVVETHPDRCRQVAVETDEPGIAMIVGAAGLARQIGPVKRARGGAGATQ